LLQVLKFRSLSCFFFYFFGVNKQEKNFRKRKIQENANNKTKQQNKQQNLKGATRGEQQQQKKNTELAFFLNRSREIVWV